MKISTLEIEKLSGAKFRFDVRDFNIHLEIKGSTGKNYAFRLKGNARVVDGFLTIDDKIRIHFDSNACVRINDYLAGCRTRKLIRCDNYNQMLEQWRGCNTSGAWFKKNGHYCFYRYSY